ncbi:MAG: hypothetical protein R6U96_02260 [Promethearchaeia archaeon]
MEEEVGKILARFSKMLKEDILEYYDRCYDYIKDLFADKQIDLKFKTNYESVKKVRDTLKKMTKSLRVALNTIGVSKDRINQLEEYFEDFTDLDDKKEGYPDYESYFVKDLKSHIDPLLLELLIEYLIDRDPSNIENLDLFDLLPRNFISKLDQVKDQFITSSKLKDLINQERTNLGDYLDPSTLTLNEEFVIEEEKEKETADSQEAAPSTSKADEGEILEKLRLAKETNIEALKASIKSSTKERAPEAVEPVKAREKMEPTPEVVESTLDVSVSKQEPGIEEGPAPSQQEPTQVEESTESELVEQSEPPISKSIEEISESLDTKAMLIKKSGYFLDHFGEFPEVKSDSLGELTINRLNLITSRDNDSSFLDLENLYYYVSILKMMNVDLPFTEEKIISLLDKYTQNGLFISQQEGAADPVSVFYGLSILSEYDLLNTTSIIDLLDIEMFLEGELSKFIPEKLHLNFYTLLGLKILEKNGSVITPKTNLLNPLLNLKVREFEKYDPPLDIFEKIALIRLLDPSTDLSHYRGLYTNELKKAVLNSEKKIDTTITDAARSFLALKLLDLSQKEFKLVQNLREYIANKANYFSQENLNEDFNWKTDKYAYKVELRMLYWALITCY